MLPGGPQTSGAAEQEDDGSVRVAYVAQGLIRIRITSFVLRTVLFGALLAQWGGLCLVPLIVRQFQIPGARLEGENTLP